MCPKLCPNDADFFRKKKLHILKLYNKTCELRIICLMVILLIWLLFCVLLVVLVILEIFRLIYSFIFCHIGEYSLLEKIFATPTSFFQSLEWKKELAIEDLRRQTLMSVALHQRWLASATILISSVIRSSSSAKAYEDGIFSKIEFFFPL